MLHSELSLLKWVLLPDKRSISEIASIEAIGALPLNNKSFIFMLYFDQMKNAECITDLESTLEKNNYLYVLLY